MCGIAAIFRFDALTELERPIRVMTDCIAHRGPDAEGIYVDDHVALGHRRLSIIDVKASANQPLWDHSRRYAIIFNGEVYNYRELKAALPDYPYKTDSDTEVIFAYYEKFGPACLQHMNGMFAFAIYDTQLNELFVARDRVGKKPMYYALTDAYFIMCSDVRGILRSGLWKGKLAQQELSEYLMYQAPMRSHSLVEGIHKLAPGSYAIVKQDGVEFKSYWSYDGVQRTTDNIETAKQKVKDLLLDAVRLRMRSDVPFGAFLSGGIDSSLIVACMAELSDQPIDTFNISFSESAYDESTYAEQIAKQYNTRHHRIVLKPEVFLDSLDSILGAMDTPSGDGPNTYIVSQHTRQSGVKVALSGLGGDELFAGYNKFLFYYKLMRNRWVMQLPAVLRKGMANITRLAGNNQRIDKLNQLLQSSAWKPAAVYPLLRQAYSKQEANSLLSSPSNEDQVVTGLDKTFSTICWMAHFSKATVAEMECYTRDVLLRDTDQMAMAHALEVRVPFFDYRLIEYILSLPDAYKYPHKPKQLLVEAMSPRLPAAIVHRKKMGFTLPFDRWLRNELSPFASQKINYLADRSEFNGDAVRQKWIAFQKGDKRVVWSRIWQLVVLSDWLERNGL